MPKSPRPFVRRRPDVKPPGRAMMHGALPVASAPSGSGGRR
ncbi:hypothetical protein [Brachybacterium sacelli]